MEQGGGSGSDEVVQELFVQGGEFEPRFTDGPVVSIVGRPAFKPVVRNDIPIREHTARHLALGVAITFALTLFCVCVAYLAIVAMSVYGAYSSQHTDGWLQWQKETTGQVSDFAQTIGTLLASPFGVVLGFYFRDRK